MKEKSKSFFLLTGSIFVMAIGIYFFKFANNFTFGGITGLAVLVAKTGVMSASDFTFIMNMLLLLIGLIVLGKTFALTTAYCSISLSAFIITGAYFSYVPSADRSADAGTCLRNRTSRIQLCCTF